MGAEQLSFKDKVVLNAKLAIGPAAVLAEKGVAHIGANTWARGEAFARGMESDGFQRALGAVVKTEGDLQAHFGFQTGEQLLMRGAQVALLLFAGIAENQQLPANWNLDKMPKSVKYVAETARALYFASLVAAPVILDKMIKGEPVEPVSAGLVLGVAGAGLLYSTLRVMAVRNIEAREWRKEELLSREIDLKVDDWQFNYKTEELMKDLKKRREESEAKNAQIVNAAGETGKSRELDVAKWLTDGTEIIIPDELLKRRPQSLRARVARLTEKHLRRVDLRKTRQAKK